MTMRPKSFPGRQEHGAVGTGAIFRLIADESGVTAIEYAVIAGLIALAVVLGAGQVGTWIVVPFSKIASGL
jgi:pilus assembly protein Flp/PilA